MSIFDNINGLTTSFTSAISNTGHMLATFNNYEAVREAGEAISDKKDDKEMRLMKSAAKLVLGGMLLGL